MGGKKLVEYNICTKLILNILYNSTILGYDVIIIKIHCNPNINEAATVIYYCSEKCVNNCKDNETIEYYGGRGEGYKKDKTLRINCKRGMKMAYLFR